MNTLRLITKTCSTAMCLLVSMNGFGADLLHVYKLAETNDQEYLQGLASHRVVLESRPQALSQLFPP